MREQVLWRKVARIIMRLAERLQISPERALAIFYDTRTCSMLHDSKYGLHLMSDDYILNDLLRELGDFDRVSQTKCRKTRTQRLE